ncbi:hypothetical protein [Staphylococcus americanisciuri]|uniref:Uncharacterized protein n=1 Tax=Staphylococcus americanisciuri TaxID=2973940 RepID=A0ABT2F1L5_9STAP|nr:hypothetical protein [Staphylococcus americanisciuri]MCS4486254.1 hypothetical protein [Staphylococcus americanisciuri]
MKLTKLELIMILILAIEFTVCLIIMEHLTIFQYMIFVQIIPSFISAIVIGNVAARSKYKWLIIPLFSIVFVIVIFLILQITPISTIENNTVQSKTSVILFNRNMKFSTYFGLFFQEFILSTFIVLIIGVFRKIKGGKF